MKSVIVDRREPQAIINQLRRLGCVVYVKTLKLGDYIINDKVVVERKQVNDLVSSIVDKLPSGKSRLYSQCERLAMQTKWHPFIVVEGLIQSKRITEKTIEGALASVFVRYGISIMHVHSKTEMSYLVAKVITKAAENKVLIPRRVISKAHGKDAWLAQILGVSVLVAKRMRKEYGSGKNVLQVAMINPKELSKFEGVGPATLKKIELLFK